MKTAAFVLMYWVGNVNPAPVITATGSGEFADKASCESAAASVKRQVYLPQYKMIFGYTCEPKSK